MISKKLLVVVIVCLALLLGAFGAYSYIVISDLQSRTNSLQETISSLEEEINQLQNEISHKANFVFEWTSVSRGEWAPPAPIRVIVVPLNETLRMELAFTVKDENLSIIANVNDDSADYLGIVLDANGDGKLDIAYPLFHDNTTYLYPPIGWWEEGELGPFPACRPDPSPYHTCVIEQGKTTFNVTLPLPLGDLVHICYWFDIGWVYIRINIGLPLGAD